jgi:hypothetical protein
MALRIRHRNRPPADEKMKKFVGHGAATAANKGRIKRWLKRERKLGGGKRWP